MKPETQRIPICSRDLNKRFSDCLDLFEKIVWRTKDNYQETTNFLFVKHDDELLVSTRDQLIICVIHSNHSMGSINVSVNETFVENPFKLIDISKIILTELQEKLDKLNQQLDASITRIINENKK